MLIIYAFISELLYHMYSTNVIITKQILLIQWNQQNNASDFISVFKIDIRI